MLHDHFSILTLRVLTGELLLLLVTIGGSFVGLGFIVLCTAASSALIISKHA